MRAKIVFPNLLAVLVLGIGSYVYLSGSLRARATEKLDADLLLLSSLFDRSEALRGLEILNDVRREAMTRNVTSVFSRMDMKKEIDEEPQAHDARIRQAWFSATVRSVETCSEIWASKGRKPAIAFITDRNGVVLARNTTPNACPAGKNVTEVLPVVKRALDGEAAYAIWSVDHSPLGTTPAGSEQLCALMNTGILEMAAAPIWVDDEVAGVLFAGFEVSNGVAEDKSGALGLDLAVITADGVYSSSFRTDTARQSLDSALKAPAVATELVTAFDQNRRTPVFELEIEGVTYRTVVSPSVNAMPGDRIALVYMGSVGQSAYFAHPLILVLVMTLVGALIVIIAGILLAGYFMAPVLAIEEGLLKLINGESDYRFDVESSELGGLGYRINQLVNVLTEQDEESADQP